jgi:hypothetical protein
MSNLFLNLLPYRVEEFSTPLKPDELIKLINEFFTEVNSSDLIPNTTSKSPSQIYYGKVENNTFKITKVIRFRTSISYPVIIGEITSENNQGSLIKLTFRPTVWATLVWLACTTFMILNSIALLLNGDFYINLIPILGFFILSYCVPAILLLPEFKLAKNELIKRLKLKPKPVSLSHTPS